MCGCEAHHNVEAICSCLCPEHEVLHHPKKEPRFDFSINLFDISEGKLEEVRMAIEAAVSPTDDVAYSAAIREM